MQIISDFPLINAVIQKKQLGHSFTLGNHHLVVHKAQFAQILGNETLDIFETLNFVAEENALPQYFHIYKPLDALTKAVEKDERFGFRYRKRVQLRFNKPLVDTQFRAGLQKGFYTKEITEENLSGLADFDLNITTRFWQSSHDFLSQGYGSIVLSPENNPVSVCYASCVANNLAEVDIVTLPNYRGMGLAKAATEAFIEQSIQQNIKANWDCFEENVASLKTAQSLGFEPIQTYWFLSIYNKNRDHEK